jgi:hypothetical protein
MLCAISKTLYYKYYTHGINEYIRISKDREFEKFSLTNKESSYFRNNFLNYKCLECAKGLQEPEHFRERMPWNVDYGLVRRTKEGNRRIGRFQPD